MGIKGINEKISLCQNDLTEDLFNSYQDSKFIAVDTEAMGLIHGRDRLCLIQLCNEDNLRLISWALLMLPSCQAKCISAHKLGATFAVTEIHP